jgi:anti-sigma-K factor RskA
MIDEARHDLAIAYVLGSLEGEARHEFEAWLESDSDLQNLVDELQESTGALVYTTSWQQAPPHLREKVLAGVRGESEAPPPPKPARRLGWIPWAVAAGLAATCIVLRSERETWRAKAQKAEQEIQLAVAESQALGKQANGLDGQLQLSQAQAKTHVEQIGELRNEVARLRGHDALAQMKIAKLSAQVATFAKAGAVVVWDPQEQRGVIKLANLPKPAPGKDYQLWVVDPKYPNPVNGGVLPVSDDGTARLTFTADQPIEDATKFAISIEQTGGVPVAAGPIIFAGE